MTSVLASLPFREVWALDFEFSAPPGERQVPVAMVAIELRTGREVRLWLHGRPSPPVPFDTGPDSLFVAYYASAEWRCFLALGWPLPSFVLCLHAEFSMAMNTGENRPKGFFELLNALATFGVRRITKTEKDAGRGLVLRGPPWSPAERGEVIDYCRTDVVCLGPLMEHLLPRALHRKFGLEHALLRGRYTKAVARMERAGVPIDTDTLARLREHWDGLRLKFIESEDMGLYDGTTFKRDRFARWLRQERIAWPLNDSGTELSLKDQTFKDMAKVYPQVAPLRELRHTLSDLRLENLAVGSDGRNRTLISPFRASTGRNGPSSNKFVFGASVWVRGLVKPPAGRALAYIDWSAQEVAIAAALSGDPALLESVQSGDPYLSFAKLAGLAPPDATKDSHKVVRDLCKACVLGTAYGMGPVTLAYRIGGRQRDAEQLLEAHRRTYPVFWKWVDRRIDVAMLTGEISTGYGWVRRVVDAGRPTSIQNFPMQAHGVEMLRITCSLATERGLNVIAPVHDAVVVEADLDEIEHEMKLTREAMDEASRLVLDGLEVATDVEIIRWPNRYMDVKRGRRMWERAMKALGELEGSE